MGNFKTGNRQKVYGIGVLAYQALLVFRNYKLCFPHNHCSQKLPKTAILNF
ncbi:hypothetical protein NIES2100_46050 [Calothrix sp. NIES-2100]|nr:hypothetical protein NIES2100_46050 [Calothrix sp. NIES-2100]